MTLRLACDLDASLLLNGGPLKERFLAEISHFNYFDRDLSIH